MADERIAYTEEMVGSGHPTKTDTLNRLTLVEHDTDGTHKTDAIAEKTPDAGVTIDGVKLKDGGALAITGGTNTFNLTNGTASLDVATGKTVNIDDDVTVAAELHVEAATHVNQDLTTDAGPTFDHVHVPSIIAPSNSLVIKPTTDATTAIQIADKDGNAIINVDTTNDRVGIGTTNPSSKLTVEGATNYDDAYPTLIIRDSVTPAKMVGIGYDGTNDIAFIQARQISVGYKKLVLNPSGGNVGIGTTTFIDSEKLRVNGDIYSDGDVSALTFTDRTPYFDGDAIAAMAAIQGKNGEIDHSTLPEFARKTVKKNIYTDVPLTEISSDDAFETVSVEQDKIVVDENGKKSRAISGTISSGYEVKDGQVVENFVPVYEKETVKKTQLKKNIHFDSATGKLYQTSGGEVFEKDGILYERILSGQEDQERRDLGAMISILTVAIQQQQAQIELLKARVTALESK